MVNDGGHHSYWQSERSCHHESCSGYCCGRNVVYSFCAIHFVVDSWRWHFINQENTFGGYTLLKRGIKANITFSTLKHWVSSLACYQSVSFLCIGFGWILQFNMHVHATGSDSHGCVWGTNCVASLGAWDCFCCGQVALICHSDEVLIINYNLI